jgi:four helix bundle protein
MGNEEGATRSRWEVNDGTDRESMAENDVARKPRGHELEARTKRFALRIVRFVDALPTFGSRRVLGGQLLRAGTAVGANHRAARRARSKREFVAKLGLVLEEADESAFWLELLGLLEDRPVLELKALLQEAGELVAIFSAVDRDSQDIAEAVTVVTRWCDCRDGSCSRSACSRSA